MILTQRRGLGDVASDQLAAAKASAGPAVLATMQAYGWPINVANIIAFLNDTNRAAAEQAAAAVATAQQAAANPYSAARSLTTLMNANVNYVPTPAAVSAQQAAVTVLGPAAAPAGIAPVSAAVVTQRQNAQAVQDTYVAAQQASGQAPTPATIPSIVQIIQGNIPPAAPVAAPGTPILTHATVDLPHGAPVIAPNGQAAYADGQGGIIAGAAPATPGTVVSASPTLYADPNAAPSVDTTAATTTDATAAASTLPSWAPFAGLALLGFLFLRPSRSA